MKKYIYAIIAISILAAAVGIGLNRKSNMASQTAPKSVGVASEGLDWGKDPHTLVGFSNDVFVGKVLRVVGNEKYPISGYPSTEFEVQVIYNIKGNLQNTVTIAQGHGNVIPLAKVNSTYIFAVSYDTLSGWYLFGIPTESYQLLTDDASLSDADLKSLAKNSPKVRVLEEAYPNEIIYNTANHIDYNSYASRHYDAAGQLIDDTVVLHQQYLIAHPEAAAQFAEQNVSTPAASESAPAANDQPSATPEVSSSPTPTPEESVASTETSITPEVTPSSTPAEEPTPTPTDMPVQS